MFPDGTHNYLLTKTGKVRNPKQIKVIEVALQGWRNTCAKSWLWARSLVVCGYASKAEVEAEVGYKLESNMLKKRTRYWRDDTSKLLGNNGPLLSSSLDQEQTWVFMPNEHKVDEKGKTLGSKGGSFFTGVKSIGKPWADPSQMERQHVWQVFKDGKWSNINKEWVPAIDRQ